MSIISLVKRAQLHPITASDLPFLSILYASTRIAELETTGWSDDEKKYFLGSQFQLQHNYYQQQFPSAQFQLITLNDRAVGRLYYGWEENNLRLIDIAFLPEYRYQGLGSALIRELMTQVAAGSGSLLLHVEVNNSAREWYLRLGFVAGATDGMYQRFSWAAE